MVGNRQTHFFLCGGGGGISKTLGHFESFHRSIIVFISKIHESMIIWSCYTIRNHDFFKKKKNFFFLRFLP